MALDCFELDLRKLSTKFGIKSELEILQELKFLLEKLNLNIFLLTPLLKNIKRNLGAV